MEGKENVSFSTQESTVDNQAVWIEEADLGDQKHSDDELDLTDVASDITAPSLPRSHS